MKHLIAVIAVTVLLVAQGNEPQTPPAPPGTNSPAPAPVPPDSEATNRPEPAKEPVPPASASPAKGEEGTAAPGPPPRFVQMPPPPVDPSDFVLTSDVEMVLLDVAVKDSNGGFASGLTKEQFKIFENNAPQDVTVFSAQDVPVTVGLVVDNSGSVRPKRPEIVTAALTFVQRSHPQDEVFVVNFNDTVRLGLPEEVKFTDDLNLLRAALLNNPVQGRTALYDGLKKALVHLNDGRRDKKTLVLVSDGGDNASETTEDEIIQLAQQSLATIYTVGIFNPDDKDKNPGFLKKLAHITGGEAFMPEKITELVSVCEKIAKDIRNRYTLGYVPADRKFDGKVRKIKVLASAPDRGKLTARTRTEYLAVTGNEFARHKHRHR